MFFWCCVYVWLLVLVRIMLVELNTSVFGMRCTRCLVVIRWIVLLCRSRCSVFSNGVLNVLFSSMCLLLVFLCRLKNLLMFGDENIV